MKKILTGIGVAGIILGTTVGIAFAQTSTPAIGMTTTTLGTNIDTVSNLVLAYIGTLLTKYWPFVLIGLILVGVFAFGKRLIGRLFGA